MRCDAEAGSFYVVGVPISLFIILLGVINTLCHEWIAFMDVIAVLLFRYELWAKGIKPGELFNCPWKKTLLQVYLDAR